MESTEYTKWVACWGNAPSITDQKEAMYAKNITLRYPIRMVFDGCAFFQSDGNGAGHIE